jgi:hypothetical protein
MGANNLTAPPINVIHCLLVDEMVCGVVAINATRSGCKYGNEDSEYRGKEKGLCQVRGRCSEVGENVMLSFTLKGEWDRKRALR